VFRKGRRGLACYSHIRCEGDHRPASIHTRRGFVNFAVGETTLFWLQRTRKLNAIRIGSRVLFPAGEIERIAARGASLTEAEKEAAAKRDREVVKGCAAGEEGQARRRKGIPEKGG
jgi:hypothetical protein